MRRLLFKNVARGRVTEPAPAPNEAALAELAANLIRRELRGGRRRVAGRPGRFAYPRLSANT